MSREAFLRWILIICSKILFVRFNPLELTREDPAMPVGGEAWPGGDVRCVFTTKHTPGGSVGAPAA